MDTKDRVEGTRATVIDIIGRTGRIKINKILQDLEVVLHKLKFNWLVNKEHLLEM